MREFKVLTLLYLPVSVILSVKWLILNRPKRSHVEFSGKCFSDKTSHNSRVSKNNLSNLFLQIVSYFFTQSLFTLQRRYSIFHEKKNRNGFWFHPIVKYILRGPWDFIKSVIYNRIIDKICTDKTEGMLSCQTDVEQTIFLYSKGALKNFFLINFSLIFSFFFFSTDFYNIRRICLNLTCNIILWWKILKLVSCSYLDIKNLHIFCMLHKTDDFFTFSSILLYLKIVNHLSTWQTKFNHKRIF